MHDIVFVFLEGGERERGGGGEGKGRGKEEIQAVDRKIETLLTKLILAAINHSSSSHMYD